MDWKSVYQEYPFCSYGGIDLDAAWLALGIIIGWSIISMELIWFDRSDALGGGYMAYDCIGRLRATVLWTHAVSFIVFAFAFAPTAPRGISAVIEGWNSFITVVTQLLL